MKWVFTHFLLFFIFLMQIKSIQAQQKAKRYVEIKWDNDFLNYRLSGTDKYYTNGLFINLLISEKKADFFHKHFVHDSVNTQVLQEVGLYQLMFTPNNIAISEISSGDYPYSGLLSGYYSTIFNNFRKGMRISSSLHIATMGRFSLAEEGQRLLHKLIHYQVPQGWNNEVNKTLLVNYELMIEKGILRNNKWVQLIPRVSVRLGMINTSFSTGATFQFGLSDDYFSYIRACTLEQYFSSKKIRLYFTWQPKFTCTAWNGLLEPALKKTIETYNAAYKKDNAYPVVKRFLFDHAATIYLLFKNTRIGFTQSFYAKELSTTSTHEVGSINVAFKL